MTEPTTEAGQTLPRCKDSRNPNWTTMGGYCLTHQQPLDACREEMAEAAAAERERIRAASHKWTRHPDCLCGPTPHPTVSLGDVLAAIDEAAT